MLREPIGAGAMGEVWRADHRTLGTGVAVKIVDTAGRPDAGELLARFQLEARSAAQLKSPNVVQILDYGVESSIAFIAMELLVGESLEQRLARRGVLRAGEAAFILREMARGIDRAHALGIVHRDLKPPNVFLAKGEGVDVVKVLDFGIAKLLGAPSDAHLKTQEGFVVGTPAYMSPEQILGKPLDHRSDLWQLGVITFECITGKRPFEGGTLGQIFMKICNAPLPVPSQIGAVPQGFDVWFAKALSREPNERFRSAGEMAEALCALLTSVHSGTPLALLTGPVPQPRADEGPAQPPAMAATGKVAWSTGAVIPPARSRKAVVLAVLGGIAALVLALLLLVPGSAPSGAAQGAKPLDAASSSSAPSAIAAAPTEAALTSAAPPPSASQAPADHAKSPRKPAAPAPRAKNPNDDRLGL